MLSNHPQTAVFLGSAIQNNAHVCAQLKAGRTQTNNAQLYLAEHYFEWLSQEKLQSAGDC